MPGATAIGMAAKKNAFPIAAADNKQKA